MPPTYKLRHPDARGRAEPMRIMLAIAGKLEVRASTKCERARACLLGALTLCVSSCLRHPRGSQGRITTEILCSSSRLA